MSVHPEKTSPIPEPQLQQTEQPMTTLAFPEPPPEYTPPTPQMPTSSKLPPLNPPQMQQVQQPTGPMPTSSQLPPPMPTSSRLPPLNPTPMQQFQQPTGPMPAPNQVAPLNAPPIQQVQQPTAPMPTSSKLPPLNPPPMHQVQQPTGPMPAPNQVAPLNAPPIQQMHQPMAPMPMMQQQSMANAVVVNQQPTGENRLVIGNVYGHRDWTTGLYGCLDDCGGCMKTCCCSDLTIMEISIKLNENMCLANFVPGSLVALRTRLRTLGGIQGSICNDYCALCWCYCCALCQMDREIKAMQL